MTDFNSKPSVFFVYSHRDSEKLIPVLTKASAEAGFLPIFAKEIKIGENIMQKLRSLLLYADIVIVIITPNFSPWMFKEIGFSEAIQKLVLFFMEKSTSIPMDFYGYRYVSYEEKSELFQSIVTSLNNLKSRLLREENVNIKMEQEAITHFLTKSLEKNVLVLGKDSDSKGLKKMRRVANVLSGKDYNPILLKDLPEIKFLSLEGKMIRVGANCRFIITEDSRPSGHIDELNLCVACEYITATVREAGISSTWMQAHYPMMYTFINRFCYRGNTKRNVKDALCNTTYSSIEKATEEAIMWAENRILIQERYFKSKFPFY